MRFARTAVTALLVASAINLALMVPGGFVETRDFSAYSPLVLGAFNVFLTVLGLGSLVLAYAVFRTGRLAGLVSLAGLGFVAVYLLDLGRIFPVPPEPMSAVLATLEWIGTVLGAALVLAAYLSARHSGASTGDVPAPKPSMPALVGLAAIALVIVAFATKSAMGV
ncbi:hypothetical protein [Devosia aquimaris]|uniref:hypothetical protein n=1 Tax=Devosia aquimaris TaxID=2866214 RepID=UPI001CD15967|nr:hypothetical protein [Devosia sp. CJK-A8-3]